MGSFSRITIDGVGYDVVVDDQTLKTLTALLANSNVKEVDSTSNWNTDNIYIYRGTTSGSFTSNHVYTYRENQWTDIGEYSREGYNTYPTGENSHAEGAGSEASGIASHAEGSITTASEFASHAEGAGTTASEEASHAEGISTTASGQASHVEGYSADASGNYSHAEGYWTTASGQASHTEGTQTTANGFYSHAGGEGTEASRKAQTVVGRYNVVDTQGANTNSYGKYAYIVGNGSDASHRSNAFAVNWNGDIECATINGVDVTSKVEAYPNLPTTDGIYGIKIQDGVATFVALS